jgi:hypothetical protein
MGVENGPNTLASISDRAKNVVSVLNASAARNREAQAARGLALPVKGASGCHRT